MPISFPRTFVNNLPIVGMEFYLEPMAELTPLRSGNTIAKALGPSLWRGRWQSAVMEEADFGTVRAWYATLLSYESFLGYDKLREYPVRYRDGWGAFTVGGSPFSGNGTLNNVNANTVDVTLGALPVGLILSPGDYISFAYGSSDSRALHMVVDGGTASGSGNVTVEVRPHVRVGWSAGATVRLFRPHSKFIMVPGSWSGSADYRRHGQVSFEALQSL